MLEQGRAEARPIIGEEFDDVETHCSNRFCKYEKKSDNVLSPTYSMRRELNCFTFLHSIVRQLFVCWDVFAVNNFLYCCPTYLNVAMVCWLYLHIVMKLGDVPLNSYQFWRSVFGSPFAAVGTGLAYVHNSLSRII